MRCWRIPDLTFARTGSSCAHLASPLALILPMGVSILFVAGYGAAAFLNADGGVLLIGVDDHGTGLGLDLDLALLKTPDVDRFELWLRDLITTPLGTAAAALAEVDFANIDGEPGRSDSARAPPLRCALRFAFPGAGEHTAGSLNGYELWRSRAILGGSRKMRVWISTG